MRDIRGDTVDDLKIHKSRDAIIRVTSTAICGSDLHIYNGSQPQFTLQTLGHEFIGHCDESAPGRFRIHSERVYATPFDNFALGQIFDKGIIIQAGQAPAHKHIEKLMQHVSNGDVKLDGIITHRLPLSQVPHGYDIFRHEKDACLKVVLKPGE